MAGPKIPKVVQRCFANLWFHASVCLGSIAAAAFFGAAFWQGWALGVVGTAASVLGTGGVVKLLATAAENKANAGFGNTLIALGFLIKLPVFVGCAAMAQGLPGPGPAAFCLGLGLVYSLLVGWAQARV